MNRSVQRKQWRRQELGSHWINIQRVFLFRPFLFVTFLCPSRKKGLQFFSVLIRDTGRDRPIQATAGRMAALTALH